MTQNEWDYWYEGKPAQEVIKDPYGNVMEQPGHVRDGGSFWERMGNVACWNTLMDENRYMIQRWNEFMSPDPLDVERGAALTRRSIAPSIHRTDESIRAPDPLSPGSADLVLLVFLRIPLAMVIVVSFLDYDMFDIIAEFTLRNYVELFDPTSPMLCI